MLFYNKYTAGENPRQGAPKKRSGKIAMGFSFFAAACIIGLPGRAASALPGRGFFGKEEKMKADLHMHSTASDGTMTPSQMAEECQKAGLCYAALTDHDCVAGVEEFMARAEQLGIRAVSGVEFSVQYEGELHILGYGVDLGHSRFARECRVLAQRRETRVQEMAEKLCRAGYRISLERIRAHAGGDLIGRPHIAAALVEAGYARDIPDAFQRFLNRGGAGFVERYRLSEENAISLIHEAGGKAVWAHPKLALAQDFPAMLDRLVAEGLDGIEAFYPMHSDEECAYYMQQGRQRGLFISQGSDAHGTFRPSTFVGKEQRGDEELSDCLQILFK